MGPLESSFQWGLSYGLGLGISMKSWNKGSEYERRHYRDSVRFSGFLKTPEASPEVAFHLIKGYYRWGV